MMPKQFVVMATVIVLLIVVVTLSLGPTLSPTGYAVKDGDMNICTDYNLDDMTKVSDLQPCVSFRDELVTEMGTQGLLSLSIDPLLLFTLAQQESSCGTNEQGAAGPLAVDACNPNPDGSINLDCPTREIRIREGLNIFKYNYNILSSQGLQGQELLELTLFAYNRGIGTALKVIQYKKQGMSTEAATQKACNDIYAANCQGNRDAQGNWCKYDSKGNDRCSLAGYGSNYATTVLTKYKDYCGQVGGTIEQGVFDATQVKLTRYGTYLRTPSFSITRPYQSPYDVLQEFAEDVIASCANNPDVCIPQKITQFNQGQSDIILSESCNTGRERIFEDFVKKVQDCAVDTPTLPCMCDLTSSYPGADYDVDIVITALSEQPYVYQFSLKNTVLHYVVQTDYPLEFSEISFSYDDEFEMKTEKLDGKDNLYLFVNLFATNPVFALGSVESNALIGLDGSAFVTPISNSDLCPANDGYYTFCAATKQEYTVLQNDAVVSELLQIQFSLYVKDEIPPESIEGLMGTRNQAVIVLEWQPTMDNLDHYTIYYDTQDLSTSTNIKSQKINTEISKIKSFQLNACSTECSFSIINEKDESKQITLEKADYLFQVSQQDKIVAVLYGLNYQEDYYIGVTATDKAGNEQPLIPSLKEGENYIMMPK